MTDTNAIAHFPGFGEPQDMICGARASCGMSEDIRKASQAGLVGTAEDVASANCYGYQNSFFRGFYADPWQHETYLTNVYRVMVADEVLRRCDDDSPVSEAAIEADPSIDWYSDDSESYRYAAMIESNDSDCAWLDPELYESDMDAARAATYLGERLAEHEREYQRIWSDAGAARHALIEANDYRRQAIKFERAAREHRAELRAIHKGRVSLFALRFIYPAAWRTVETLEAEARRLWNEAEAARESAFSTIDEGRPSQRPGTLRATIDGFFRGEVPAWQAENASWADAWFEGWHCV